MSDDFETLFNNQMKINDELRSHIDDLNKMIQGQLCIPDPNTRRCEFCEFKKFYFEKNGHVQTGEADAR